MWRRGRPLGRPTYSCASSSPGNWSWSYVPLPASASRNPTFASRASTLWASSVSLSTRAHCESPMSDCPRPGARTCAASNAARASCARPQSSNTSPSNSLAGLSCPRRAELLSAVEATRRVTAAGAGPAPGSPLLLDAVVPGVTENFEFVYDAFHTGDSFFDDSPHRYHIAGVINEPG